MLHPFGLSIIPQVEGCSGLRALDPLRVKVREYVTLTNQEKKMKVERKKLGQGLTEYIIILAIVAIGTILVIGLFGKQIKGVFTGIAGSLAGKNNQQDDKGFNEGKDEVLRAGMDSYDEQPGGE